MLCCLPQLRASLAISCAPVGLPQHIVSVPQLTWPAPNLVLALRECVKQS